MRDIKMYQVSTLQALLLGYFRAVVPVEELLEHGNIGLGTFTDVDGEMIVIDGTCYRATADGTVVVAEPDRGVSFSTVCRMEKSTPLELQSAASIDDLKVVLNKFVDDNFALNSMHVVRIDGEFDVIDARSETGYESMHVSLKTILGKTQRSFKFENISGSLVCVYFPDYMDTINAAGWHLHFISDDRKYGGHVFDLAMKSGHGEITKINSIELRLPEDPVFDTYALKQASKDELKSVEQGKGSE